MRLIDADKLIGKLKELRDIWVGFEESHSFGTGMYQAYDTAVDEVNETPTVDAVKVVRCKDCKYWEKQQYSYQGRCWRLEMYPTGAWYCASGKRKEIEQDDTRRT